MRREKVKGNKDYVSFWLNILFFIAFILFATIILKMAKTQILEGENYRIELEKRGNATVGISVPRGKIFDREGKAIVDNKAIRTITYTKMKGVKSEDILNITRELAKVIEMPQQDIEKLTETDKKDFWMQLNTEKAQAKVTKQDEAKFREQQMGGKEFDKKIEELRRQRVTDEELTDLTPQDLEVLAIKSKMDSGYLMTPQVIKKDVNAKEYAIVSENLGKFSGVNTTVDWERDYKNGELFHSILGDVTSSEEGLPKERLDYYLVRDYNRNDRVGKSY
ncbi:TPA: penicillin-binding protein, partial [Bacillus cereus]|nr:penicillin-binding protein [Bacillus cereus]